MINALHNSFIGHNFVTINRTTNKNTIVKLFVTSFRSDFDHYDSAKISVRYLKLVYQISWNFDPGVCFLPRSHTSLSHTNKCTFLTFYPSKRKSFALFAHPNKYGQNLGRQSSIWFTFYKFFMIAFLNLLFNTYATVACSTEMDEYF